MCQCVMCSTPYSVHERDICWKKSSLVLTKFLRKKKYIHRNDDDIASVLIGFSLCVSCSCTYVCVSLSLTHTHTTHRAYEKYTLTSAVQCTPAHNRFERSAFFEMKVIFCWCAFFFWSIPFFKRVKSREFFPDRTGSLDAELTKCVVPIKAKWLIFFVQIYRKTWSMTENGIFPKKYLLLFELAASLSIRNMKKYHAVIQAIRICMSASSSKRVFMWAHHTTIKQCQHIQTHAFFLLVFVRYCDNFCVY